jgi:hypothetical protein
MQMAVPDTTRAAIQLALNAARDQLGICERMSCIGLAQTLARQDWIDIMRHRVSILEAELNAWDRGTAQ